MSERMITPRRMLQQVKHCVEEALSIVENDEDARCAVDDLDQAQALLSEVLKKLRPTARGWDRA